MQLSKKSKKIIKKFEQDVRALNGYLERSYSQDDNELLTLYVYDRLPISDETCVGSIDLMNDRRYGHPTFNVDIYNDILNPVIDDFKQVKKLQLLTVKCAHKLMKKELGM